MRIFKTRWFARFARKEGLADEQLTVAVREMERGLLDADYGGELVKKRIARKDNLDRTEEKEYRRAACIYLGLEEGEIERALQDNVLEEVASHDQKL